MKEKYMKRNKRYLDKV